MTTLSETLALRNSETAPEPLVSGDCRAWVALENIVVKTLHTW